MRVRPVPVPARAAGVLAALPVLAHAHAGSAPPDRWADALRGPPQPVVVGLLALAAVLYGLGLWRLWRRAGRGRGIAPGTAAAFAGGWALLAVALVSPLDALGAWLFSAHMVQHELMMVAVAPLMVLGRPLVAWTWALPRGWRRGVGRATARPAWRRAWGALTSPGGSWSLHALALWGWHAPAAFQAALRDPAIHTLQHLSFLGTALLFWWALLRPAARAARGRAVLYVFTTMLHMSALGALLTLSSVPWYGACAGPTLALGQDPLEDQQLGGLVMWVPAGLAYVAAGLALALRWAGLDGGPARGVSPVPPAAAGRPRAASR